MRKINDTIYWAEKHVHLFREDTYSVNSGKITQIRLGKSGIVYICDRLYGIKEQSAFSTEETVFKYIRSIL
jgi:hypothetical protein